MQAAAARFTPFIWVKSAHEYCVFLQRWILYNYVHVRCCFTSSVRDLLSAYKKDISLELQQRSVEFSSLAKRDYTQVRWVVRADDSTRATRTFLFRVMYRVR